MHTSEGAALQEENFPTTAKLLSRCANNAYGHTEVIGDLRRRNSSAYSHGGNQVVATGVADAGQTVVLSAESEMQWATAGASDKRGG
jgi:hypothetical protein